MKGVVTFATAVLLAVSNACGGSSAPQPLAPALQGTWESRFDGASPSEMSKGPAGHQIMPGTWWLIVAGNRADLQNPEGGRVEKGTILSGSQVRFPANPVCPGQDNATPGEYSFSITDKRLTFAVLDSSDSCNDRITTLTAHPWIKAVT